MLKRTVESLEEIPEAFRAEYAELEDGKGFELQVDGLDGLLNAKRQEKEARKAAEAKNRDLEKKVSELGGMVDQAKFRESDLTEKISKAEQSACDFVRNWEVKRLCQELAGPRAQLLERFVQERLSAQLEDGQVQLGILDAQGAPSDLTIDQLKREIRENKLFSPIVIAPIGSGGGATPTARPYGIATSNPSSMTSEERLQLKKSDPERFSQLFGVNPS